MKTFLHQYDIILLSIVLCSIFLMNTTNGVAETTETTKPMDLMFPADSPPTARHIEPFKTLQKDASVKDMVSIIGKPDEDIGSGIFIFVYNLDDGTRVLIGTSSINNPPKYMVHISKGGREDGLIKN